MNFSYRECLRCRADIPVGKKDAIVEEEEPCFIVRKFRCPTCGMIFSEVYEHIRDEDEDGNEIHGWGC